MDVKTFIAETLSQIVGGIHEAQAADGGVAVNAELHHATPGGHLIPGGSRGMFTRVDFDIAISAESSGSGKGSLQVFGIASAEGGGEKKSGYANRVQFSIPVRLPTVAGPPRTVTVPRE